MDDLRKKSAQNISSYAQASIIDGNYAKASELFEEVSGNILDYTGKISPYNFWVYNQASDNETDPYISFLNTNKVSKKTLI